MNQTLKNYIKSYFKKYTDQDYRLDNLRVMREAKHQAKKALVKFKKSKPSVLILCYSFYGGGAERVACRLAEGLMQRYQLVLLCAQKKTQSYLQERKIPLIVLPTFQGDAEELISLWVEYTRWLKENFRFQSAISFMYTMNMINVRSKNGTAVICSERNNPAKREPEHMKDIEMFYEKADHVVFQTEKVQQMFSKNVLSHSSVIPNPVEVSSTYRGNSRRIITIGRLNRQKNQAMLLHAFAEFYKQHPDYQLSFYGDGELLEELKSLSAQLGIQHAVHFHGNISNLHENIEDAQMFVLPSDYEGMSNALMECMSMGMPCISTACEGSLELIQSGENGILTEIGNQAELETAMKQLAESEQLRKRLGDQAKKTAQMFRPEIVIKEWETLLEKTTARS